MHGASVPASAPNKLGVVVPGMVSLWRHEDQELRIILSYIECLKPVWAT